MQFTQMEAEVGKVVFNHLCGAELGVFYSWTLVEDWLPLQASYNKINFDTKKKKVQAQTADN